MTPGDGSGAARSSVEGATLFVHRSAAEPGKLRAVRIGLDQWLAGLHWPEEDREDVVLAVSEAYSNAVEHAYPPGSPGEVTVVAQLRVDGTRRRVVLVVRDRGHWRPVPADPGHRGHGLTVVRGAMERVDIRHDVHGTTVTMTSTAVPGLRSEARQRPLRSSLQRSTGQAVTTPAVDRATGEQRHRHAGILRRAARLGADAADHMIAAEQAWARVQNTLQTSSQVVAAARRTRAHRAGADLRPDLAT